MFHKHFSLNLLCGSPEPLWRLREELTQKQLSEKTVIPQRHISEMETDKRQVGRKRAEILAVVLNVSDSRIFL
ncbi:MAG: helix-turn-helix transcriptional regulator [Deltaproteobacteria bacterium]